MAGLSNKMPHEKGNILLSLSKGGDMDRDDIEAIVEVFSKFSIFDLLLQILIGGCDQTGIYGDGFCLP